MLRRCLSSRLLAAAKTSRTLIGTIERIDGTIATVVPNNTKVSVGNSSVLEIQTPTGAYGHAQVFNLEQDGSVGVILLDEIDQCRAGLKVFATEQLLKVPVGWHMLGKVINPLGKELPVALFTKSRRLFAEDKKPQQQQQQQGNQGGQGHGGQGQQQQQHGQQQQKQPQAQQQQQSQQSQKQQDSNKDQHADEQEMGLVEQQSPNIVQRQPVNYNLLTGFKVIDSLIPIGRGQRELVVGDRQTGKTSIAISTIVNQTRTNDETLGKNNVLSVYVSIGQRMSNVARIFKLLTDYNAMRYCSIVAATASDPAGLQYLAPYSGTTLGEHFRNSGRHILLVYDDLSKQAVSYRQLSLLLRRPPGREAYPGDVFYLHSRLLERSAMMSPAKGGGSLTSLPVVETLSNDVTAYIVTNVISITDGQIYLDSKLFSGGQRPAVNTGLSVSRVGSAAQNKAMKKVGGTLKKLVNEYRKMAGEQVLGGGALSPTLIRGARALQIFNQKGPSYFLDAIIAMYAVTAGYMDDVKLNYTKFYEYLLVQKDLPVMHGQATNKYFYMYNKKINYLVRYLGIDHPLLKDEVENYLETHTNIFLNHYQARMTALKDEKDQVALKNLLYACKRAC